MIDGELVSLGPNKPFQTPKHHILLSVLRLGSGQPVQSHGGTLIFSSYVELGPASIVRPPKISGISSTPPPPKKKEI